MRSVSAGVECSGPLLGSGANSLLEFSCWAVNTGLSPPPLRFKMGSSSDPMSSCWIGVRGGDRLWVREGFEVSESSCCGGESKEEWLCACGGGEHADADDDGRDVE